MRKIVVAFTAAALAVSMLASAIPAAAAVSGFDSAYAGESAFVSLTPGQSNEFQVFFANTGATTWTVGSTSQVDLLACMEDKVTCDAQDATEATWNPGSWLSATRYATTTQASVAPGSIATFKYTVTAPAGVAAGTYHFNGDLGLHSTAAKLHPEGYFQDAAVGTGAGAAVLTSLTPNTGTTSGGTTVAIAGSGFVCTPAFPTVSFGTSTAAVTSCGATALTATSPAGAVGAVNVTVTNTGATASNALPFTYADTTKPVFLSFTVSGSLETVTFSEPVCRAAAFVLNQDWQVNNVSAATTDAVTGDSIPICTAARDNGVTTATLTLTNPMPNGAFVETTLLAFGSASTNTDITDAAGNPASAPQSRQSTAVAPETTAPTISSVTGAVGATSLTITFSEPVRCSGGWTPVGNITLTDNNSATTDPTATGFGSNACGTTQTTADSSFSVTLSSALPSATTFTLTYTSPGAGIVVEDIVGNDLASPSSSTFTTGAGDFTPPTITDARMVNNLATTDFTEVGDSFSLTFSETMNGTTTGTINIQDQDGTSLVLTCGGNVSCTWNSTTTPTMVTVTVTTALVAPALGAAGAGSTQGMQIPFNVTTLNGFADLQGNVPNVLGSPDRLVDYE
jgi:IPT/TIG domain-containing protein